MSHQCRTDESDDSQIEKTGVSWQIDMLDVFHARPADWARLQLGRAALAAHGVAARAEGGVDLLLTAHHAQHGFLQLAQLLLQGPGLLAAQALAASAVHAAPGGLERGAGRALAAPGDEVQHAGIVQSPPGVVIHLL